MGSCGVLQECHPAAQVPPQRKPGDTSAPIPGQVRDERPLILVGATSASCCRVLVSLRVELGHHLTGLARGGFTAVTPLRV